MILLTKTSDQTRQRGHTLSTRTVRTYALGTLCPPPLLACYSLHYLGWQLLDQPFLFYIFLRPTQVSPVSHMASTTLVRFLALLRLSSALPNPILVPAPFPSSYPFPSPLRLTCPSPLPSPFPLCVRPRVSIPVSVPVPAPSPLPSSFSSYAPSFTSTPAPVPVLASSPSPFPPPTLFAPSRFSDPVTPLVRCACTGTRPCERSCRVPTSATPCLQR